jgi:hypothetical protein
MEEGSYTYTLHPKPRPQVKKITKTMVKRPSIGEFLLERTMCLLRLGLAIFEDKIRELKVAQRRMQR